MVPYWTLSFLLAYAWLQFLEEGAEAEEACSLREQRRTAGLHSYLAS